MSNILSGNIFGGNPKSIGVGVASGAIIAESGGSGGTRRVGLVVVNISAGTIYLAFGSNVAALNAGIALNPSGGTWVMDEYTYTREAVNAIAHNAASQITLQEFFV